MIGKSRVLRFVIVALVITPALAAAQEIVPSFAGDRESSAELARIVESTRAAGLPVDPILAKVSYGIQVANAAPPRIVGAARTVASRLAIARDALAPSPTSADIAAGADALGSGATREALVAVRKASKNQPLLVPLGVLTQLLASNVPLPRATVIVTDLMKKGATGQQLVAFGDAVRADVDAGLQSVASLETRFQGLAAVLAAQGGGATAAAPAVMDGLQTTGGGRNSPSTPPPPKRP
jgi:hypothetical protein